MCSQQQMRATPVQLHNQAIVCLHTHNAPAKIVELGPIVQILQHHTHATQHRAKTGKRCNPSSNFILLVFLKTAPKFFYFKSF
jgi:hypothetical protein